jgi:hypothetical protein
MPKDDKLPPPMRGGRKGPEMAEEDPSIYGKLSSLAEQEGGGMGGGMGMGGGSEQQSAQLVMDGAGQLMQAAKMNPALAPFITQAIQIIQQGVQQMAGGPGGQGGQPEMGGEAGAGGAPQPKRKRVKPPQSEPQPGADQFGGY